MVRDGSFPISVSGLYGPSKALVSGSLYREADFHGGLLVVVPGTDLVGSWQVDLENLFPDRDVLVFDPAEALPFEVVAANREPTAGRLRVLASFCAGNAPAPIIIASAEALLPKLIPAPLWTQAALRLCRGEKYDDASLPGCLVRTGYERVELVVGPGQFAIRGSILDIFPFQGTPVRTEFWGDEIISLKELDVTNQRSHTPLEAISIWPAREFIYDPAQAESATERIKDAYKERRERLKGNRNALVRLNQRLTRFLEMADEGLAGSLNLLQPYFYPDQVSLFQYLPPGSLVVLDDPERCREQLRAHIALLESDYRRFFRDGQSFTPWQDYYFSEEELIREVAGLSFISISRMKTAVAHREPRSCFSLSVKEMQPFFGRPDLLVPEVRQWLRRGISVLLLTGTAARLPQLERELRDHELAPRLVENWYSGLESGRLNLGTGMLSSGFEIPGQLAIVTDRELYGHKMKRKHHTPGRAGDARNDPAQLAAGDYVVHIYHGIGRYAGIKELDAEGRRRDYLELIYAGDDRLYVPVDQMGLIQKYTGPDGQIPRLNRLGGADWARRKQRVKKRVQELAQDLLALYAQRRKTPGFAFSPDTVWQREFEAIFPFEETLDQQQAIAEVKADMEKPRPMDRLICGDVGFGKTEVAIRAAFKAVQDGKQVAVLAPTTVLGQQHYRTFQERFARYPVQVEVLSRFRSPRCQKEVIRGLGEGMVDIIIGTHRLLSGDVRFKDLGLLIIDEEQRFGVGHKEKIKLLRTNVDVLTLTATPIPRTLQMSLGGVRDLSMIETPPEERLPVQTYVLEFSPEVVQDAIRREVRRGGQIFYVHNRVQTIDRCASFLRGLVPEVTFRIAHGQMKEEELENVMWEFVNQKFDCLLCTTIIENGLDLPNVNTLIVERADQFGLAQLYQLRGRVGRSNRLAYAYFTFARDKILTEQAEKRLHALQEFTEFGSGFKLALKDLEIRGAGNLLGPEQHGHVAAVGFELYNQLLREAVAELKGEKLPERKVEAPVWELHVDSYIPDSYMNAQEKAGLYRRLAMVAGREALDDLAGEIRDRFGPLPQPVSYLFSLTRLRLGAQELKIGDVRHTAHHLAVRFRDDAGPRGADLARWGKVFGRRLSFSAVGGLEARIAIKGLSQEDLLGMLNQVLLPSNHPEQDFRQA